MTLKEARQRRKLTQEELAEKAGVEQATISAIETGRVQSPSWDTVSRLSKALRVKPDDVFPVADGSVAS
jgi:transcriptional regulator with XRE-family HTH domain